MCSDDEDLSLILGLFVIGDVFRANHLKREGDGGGQHQEGVNRGSVRKSCGTQKAGGDHVVNEVRDSNQPRPGQQRQASSEKFVPQLLRLRLSPAERDALRSIRNALFSDEGH